MNRSVLKWIAIITMTIDHIGLFLVDDSSFVYTLMRIIGRIAFPLFAFMIAEGFLHTSNLKRYVLRLFILGAVTELMLLGYYAISGFNLTHFWFLSGNGFKMNIMWALLWGLIGLWMMKRYEPFGILILTGLFLGSLVLPYGFYGLGLILIFGMIQTNKKWLYASLLTLFYCVHPVVSNGWEGINWIQLFGLMPLGILWFYRGIPGKKKMRWVYFYYPLHILVLAIIQSMDFIL